MSYFSPEHFSPRILRAFLLIFLLFGSCNSDDESREIQKTRFSLERGTNVSHWLSQNNARGEEREIFFTEEDVENIASLGFDHIRIPLDEEQLWTEEGIKNNVAFTLLHNAVKWSEKHKLRVIIVIQNLRFENGSQPLLTKPGIKENFLNIWRDLSEEFEIYPETILAYELLNEPVVINFEDWNYLLSLAVNVIREQEPERMLIIGSIGQSSSNLEGLRIPEDDPNLILSFQYYDPLLFTHHQAFWTAFGDYQGAVHYPGQVIRDEELANLSAGVAQKLRSFGAEREYNESRIQQDFQRAIDVAKHHGLDLYCGGWGALVTAPQPDRLRWYSDVHKVLEQNNIAWANWDYKSTGFGFTNGDGENFATELLKILTGENL